MLSAMAVWNRGSQNVEIVTDVRNVVAFNVHIIFIYPGFVYVYSLNVEAESRGLEIATAAKKLLRR